MTERELVDRVMSNFRKGDTETYEEIAVDAMLEAVLIAAMTQIVAWLVRRCLDANLDTTKLDRLVRWGCKRAAKTDVAERAEFTAEMIYADYGDRMAMAIIKTRKGLKRREMKKLEQAFPKPTTFANTPEFPEDA